MTAAELEFGEFIFYKNIPEFGSWVQRKVTDSIYSHSSLNLGIYWNLDKAFEFEAFHLVRLHQYELAHNQDVFAFVNVPIEVRKQVIQWLIHEYEGEVYGYLQWPAIGLRFGLQALGFKNARRYKIIYTFGISCSELMYYYLERTSKVMIALGINHVLWLEFLKELKTYHPDVFVPQDMRNLFDKYLMLFKQIYNG